MSEQIVLVVVPAPVGKLGTGRQSLLPKLPVPIVDLARQLLGI